MLGKTSQKNSYLGGKLPNPVLDLFVSTESSLSPYRILEKIPCVKVGARKAEAETFTDCYSQLVHSNYKTILIFHHLFQINRYFKFSIGKEVDFAKGLV